MSYKQIPAPGGQAEEALTIALRQAPLTNFMDLPNKLQLSIDEYLNEIDKKNIRHISISVPGHKGNFFIVDSFKLNLKRTETFSLSILFAFNPKNKHEKPLVDKIKTTDCFHDFVMTKNARGLMYSKDINSNKQDIINNVNYIIKCLYPQVDTNDIGVELQRITGWFTLEEQRST